MAKDACVCINPILNVHNMFSTFYVAIVIIILSLCFRKAAWDTSLNCAIVEFLFAMQIQ